MDKTQVIKKLLDKTVARGCTPEEAASAKAMAEKIAAAAGIDINSVNARVDSAAPRGWSSQWMKDQSQARKNAQWAEFVARSSKQYPFVNPPKKHTTHRTWEESVNETHSSEQTWTSVGDAVEILLKSTYYSYQVIADLVRAKFPDAKTSSKSVASVAYHLRKKGVVLHHSR